MAIVMAGKPFNAWDLKQVAGDTAGRLREAIQTAGELQVQLQSWPDPDLIALGLTQPEINALKGFYIGDLPTIQNALQASAWIKQLLGLGIYGYPTTVMPPLPAAGMRFAMPPPQELPPSPPDQPAPDGQESPEQS